MSDLAAPARIDDDAVGARVVAAEVAERLRVLVVAGVGAGVVLVGVGSRLAMFALRATSPDHVVGIQSDDDFTIGKFTLSGTYNLLLIGAVVGIIGAVAYRVVAPWLIGPSWFRRVTVGAGAGAVVGSMLVHPDGIDFRVLEPTWFAIALFVALPALFGAGIGPVVDRVQDPASWTARGRTRFILPIVLVACFPPTFLLLVFVTVGLVIWTVLRPSLPRVVPAPVTFSIRAICLGIAGAGLVALVDDITALT